MTDLSEQHANLYEDLSSIAQAYTVRRHLQVGDLTMAEFVAAMKSEAFAEADRLLWQWFLFGLAVGITAQD